MAKNNELDVNKLLNSIKHQNTVEKVDEPKSDLDLLPSVTIDEQTIAEDLTIREDFNDLMVVNAVIDEIKEQAHQVYGEMYGAIGNASKPNQWITEAELIIQHCLDMMKDGDNYLQIGQAIKILYQAFDTNPYSLVKRLSAYAELEKTLSAIAFSSSQAFAWEKVEELAEVCKGSPLTVEEAEALKIEDTYTIEDGEIL